MRPSLIIPISDSSRVGEARRVAAQITATARFNDVDQGRIAIIVTELANNLLRHAAQGKLLIQQVQTPAGPGIEVLSIDSGPGLENLEKSLQDGVSTAGTAGNGLGAIRRLSTVFDVYTQRSQGTVILSRVIETSTTSGTTVFKSGQPHVAWGGICLSAPGEEVCGDSWRVLGDETRLSVMVADGLGHGPLAAEASEKAIATLEDSPLDPPAICMQKSHRALSGTRGAAVAIAQIDVAGGLIKYSGVGNIGATLFFGSDSRGMCSHNGTVGVQVRGMQEFDYAFPGDGLIVMHSDGIQTRWNFDSYPGLRLRHPSVIAGVLCRDFVRGRDDVSVVSARCGLFKAPWL